MYWTWVIFLESLYLSFSCFNLNKIPAPAADSGVSVGTGPARGTAGGGPDRETLNQVRRQLVLDMS